MRRKLFNLAAAVSLMVCVAAVAFCVRSYVVSTTGPWAKLGNVSGQAFRAVPVFAGPEQSAFVGNASGRVLFIRQSAPGAGRMGVDVSKCGVLGSPSALMAYSPARAVEGAGFLGFGRASGAFPFGGGAAATYAVVSVPFWAIIVATVALPAYWLRRRIVERRWSRAGLCRACGYDLRATPGRCPECGAVPTAGVGAAA